MGNLQTGHGAASEPRQRHNVLEIVAKRPETSEKEMTTYDDWTHLVERIQAHQSGGMEELYRHFSRGIRFYLCRQTGPQDLEDRVHDLFVVIVQAIRRGDIREPERLMGFVQTVAKRQVSAHIRHVVSTRKEEIDIQSERDIRAVGRGPEQAAIFREREEMVGIVLSELTDRDREVLIRFYLKEQASEQICFEMDLTQTQFRLLKSRAKARFGELGKKKLAARKRLPPGCQVWPVAHGTTH